MAEPGQDRRSQRTRQALIDALMTLLAVRNYDAISIKDIVDQANVGRSTFYAHYPTKDDLLASGFARALETVLQHINLGDADQGLSVDTSMLFRHAQGHYDLYRALSWGTGYDLLTKDGHAALTAMLQQRLAQLVPEPQDTPVPLPVLAYCAAGTLLMLLKWWLDNRMPYSPERMNEMFQQLVMPGVRMATTRAANSPPPARE